MQNKIIKNLTLALIVLVVCLGLVEAAGWIALRYVVHNPAAHVSEAETGLQLFEPGKGLLALDVKTHFSQRLRTDEFDTSVRTNNVGFREGKDYFGAPVDLAFMGDSFAFGYGVNEEERFANVVASGFPAGTESHCYSWPNGNFPATFYIYLKSHPELVPKTLVMSLFLGNDLDKDPHSQSILYDNVGRAVRTQLKRIEPPGLRKLGLVDTIWETPYRVMSQSSTFRWFYVMYHSLGSTRLQTIVENLRESELFPLHRGELTPSALQTLEQVRFLKEDLLRPNARFLVVLIPDQIQLWKHPRCPYQPHKCEELIAKDRFSLAVEKQLSDWGVDVLNASDMLKANHSPQTPMFFKWDSHLTVAGHALLSNAILKRLRPDSLAAFAPSR